MKRILVGIIGLILLVAGAFIRIYGAGNLLADIATNHNYIHWVKAVYPRFSAEFQRLGPAFIEGKLEQLSLRLIPAGILALLASFYWRRIFEWLDNADWYQQSSVSYLRNSYLFMVTLTLLYGVDLLDDMNRYALLAELYHPTGFAILLGKQYPNESLRFLLTLVFYSSTILALLQGSKPRYFYTSAISFVFIQSITMGFEKIEHTYVTFNYVLLAMPLILSELKEQNAFGFGALLNAGAMVKSRGLFLARVLVIWSYFSAGVEKLLMSGFSWLSPENFKLIVEAHPTVYSPVLLGNAALLFALPTLSLAFQIGSPILLWRPSLNRWFVFGALIFHLGTYYLLDIGAWYTPWIAALFIFR